MTSRGDSAEQRPSFGWTLARGREAAASLPMAVWVAALIVVSTVSRFLLARGVAAPFIFQDEMLYSELAKSLGRTGHFALRDVPGLYGLSPVYSASISPAYALFNSVSDAYAAAKLLNAFFVSLSAVPAYLVARRLVEPGLALLAAALVLAVPDLLLTGTIMTENAFYPIFLLWFFALVRMLERPTIVNQVAVLALILLAYETRPQALVFAPALLTAIVIMILAELPWGAQPWKAVLERAYAYWATLLLVGVGALVFVVVEVVVRGRGIKQSLLKTYAVLGDVHYTFGGVAKWFLYLVGELNIVVGVLPFAAFLVVVAAGLRGPGSSRPTRAFVASAVSASVWILLGVAAFSSSPYVQRLEERNDFYVMPLLLIALVVWAARYAGEHPAATGIGATVAVASTGLVPVASFLNGNAVTDSFGLLAVWRTQMHFDLPAEWISPLIALFAMTAGALFVLVRARFAIVVPVVVLLFLAFANRQTNAFITQAATGSRNGGVQAPVDWIDRAVGPHAEVAALFTNARPPQAIWQNEFFNLSVGPLYSFPGRLDALPQQQIATDQQTGFVKIVGGGVVRAQYVLTDTSQFLAGTPIAADEGVGMRLYRVNGRVRVIGSLSGVYPDRWSGPTATFTGYACRSRRLRVVLAGKRDFPRHPVTVVATSAGRRLARFVVPAGQAPHAYTLRLPSDGGGPCQVDFAVTPTAVPAQVIGGDDTRALGTRFLLISAR